MKSKAFKLLICAALTVMVYSAFATEDTKTTKSCDASNSNKCVITNVGEGTGKLVVETSE